MRKREMPVMALLLILSLAGCARGDSAVLRRALDDIKPALTLMDERYALFESALGAAGSYIAAPGGQTLAAAKQSCLASIAGMAGLPDAQSALTDEDKSRLAKMGLNIADYGVPFESEAYSRADCIRSLAVLLDYLDRRPADVELIGRDVELLIRNNAVFRKADYLCLNELFCKFSGKEIEEFKDVFLPSLQTFSADRLPWDTDSAALTAKAEKLLSDAEADVEAYAEFIGERYAEMLEMRERLGNMLEGAGYGAEEIEEIMAKFDDAAIH